MPGALLDSIAKAMLPRLPSREWRLLGLDACQTSDRVSYARAAAKSDRRRFGFFPQNRPISGSLGSRCDHLFGCFGRLFNQRRNLLGMREKCDMASRELDRL